MNFKKLIKKHLLLEKRIAQIVTKMNVTFNFEFHKGSHSDSRETRPEQGENYSKILNNTPFVIRSLKWELSFPVYPVHEGGTYWRMVIGTLWRESELNRFKVGKDQLVIEID